MMEITEVNIGELKMYGRNAKKHGQAQVENVANSIERFGWQQPVVINSDGVIIIGHCRYLAAKKLGLRTVPCVVDEDLTEEEQRELRIADNKTNESPWDFELLQDETRDLNFDGFDFDFSSLEETDENTYSGRGVVEYGEDSFADEHFKYECPECGFKFN